MIKKSDIQEICRHLQMFADAHPDISGFSVYTILATLHTYSSNILRHTTSAPNSAQSIDILLVELRAGRPHAAVLLERDSEASPSGMAAPSALAGATL